MKSPTTVVPLRRSDEIEDREETLRILPAASGGTAIADRGAPHAAYPPHHRHPPESRTRRATIGARADWR